jgi:hypothetical protein
MTNHNEVLNRLLSIHSRSLPMYLSYALPPHIAGDERARDALRYIVADQRQYVDRNAQLILDNGGDVRHGAFPMVFTGLHDLSFDYLIKRMIAEQVRDIGRIESCVRDLAAAPLAQSLAEESLGAAKAHLDALEELAERTGPATVAIA